MAWAPPVAAGTAETAEGTAAAAGGNAGRGTSNSALASTIPAPYREVSHPGGVRQVWVTKARNTSWVCPPSPRATTTGSWWAGHNAAMPASTATAKDVPSPCSTV